MKECMKEIKVNFTGYKRSPLRTPFGDYPFVEFTLQPLELVPEFDFSKNYKLVEDEPEDNFKVDSFKTDVLTNLSIDEKKELLNSFFGKKATESLYPLMFYTPARKNSKTNLENKKLKTATMYGVFGTRGGGKTVSQMILDEYKPKARVQFNGNATILEIGDFKTVVKCHEEDFFTEHVGLGLALNRYYKKKSKEINVLTFYIEDYTKLAEFCLWKFVNYDKKQFKQLLAKITNCEKGKWIELE